MKKRNLFGFILIAIIIIVIVVLAYVFSTNSTSEELPSKVEEKIVAESEESTFSSPTIETDAETETFLEEESSEEETVTETVFNGDISDANVWEEVTPQIIWGNLDFWYTKKEYSYNGGTDSFQFSSKMDPIVHFIGVPNSAAPDSNSTVTIFLNGNPCTFTLDGTIQQCTLYGVEPKDTFIDIEIKCSVASNILITITGEEKTE